MSHEGLQTPSDRNDATRGTTVVIPAATAANDRLVGQSLRLSQGTWFIQVCKLVLGPMGKTPAAAPNVADPTWPVLLRVQHGRGVATWWETLTAAARGTFLTRGDDASQAAISVGGAGFVAEQEVLLVARQIISPVQPAHVETRAIADGGGKATHVVPPGAHLVQFIGAAGAGVTLAANDAAGILIASTTPGPAVGAEINVPSTCAAFDLNGLAAGKLTVAMWEVWG